MKILYNTRQNVHRTANEGPGHYLLGFTQQNISGLFCAHRFGGGGYSPFFTREDAEHFVRTGEIRRLPCELTPVRLFQVEVMSEGNRLGYINHSEQDQRAIVERVFQCYPGLVSGHIEFSYRQVAEFLELCEPGGHVLRTTELDPENWKGLETHEQEQHLKQLREMDAQAAGGAR